MRVTTRSDRADVPSRPVNVVTTFSASGPLASTRRADALSAHLTVTAPAALAFADPAQACPTNRARAVSRAVAAEPAIPDCDTAPGPGADTVVTNACGAPFLEPAHAGDGAPRNASSRGAGAAAGAGGAGTTGASAVRALSLGREPTDGPSLFRAVTVAVYAVP